MDPLSETNNILSKHLKSSEEESQFQEDLHQISRLGASGFTNSKEKPQLYFCQLSSKVLDLYLQKQYSLDNLQLAVEAFSQIFQQLKCDKEQYLYSLYCKFWNHSCQTSDPKLIHYLRVQSVKFLARSGSKNTSKLVERFIWGIQALDSEDFLPLYQDGVTTVLFDLANAQEVAESGRDALEVSKLLLFVELLAKMLMLSQKPVTILPKAPTAFENENSRILVDILSDCQKAIDTEQCDRMYTKTLSLFDSLPLNDQLSDAAVVCVVKVYLTLGNHQVRKYTADPSCVLVLLKILKKAYALLPSVSSDMIATVFTTEIAARSSILKSMLFLVEKYLSSVKGKLENSQVNLIAAIRHDVVSWLRKMSAEEVEGSDQILYLARVVDNLVWNYAVVLYHTKCNYDAAAVLLTASCCDTLEFAKYKTEENQRKMQLSSRLQNIVDCRIRAKSGDKLYQDLGKCLATAIQFGDEEFRAQILETLVKVHMKVEKKQIISSLDLVNANTKQKWTNDILAGLLIQELEVYDQLHPLDAEPMLMYLTNQLLELSHSAYTNAFAKVYQASCLWWNFRSPEKKKDFQKGAKLVDSAIRLLKDCGQNPKSIVLLSMAEIWKFWCSKALVDLEAEAKIQKMEALISTVKSDVHKGEELEENPDIAAGYSFLHMGKEQDLFCLLEKAVETGMSSDIPAEDMTHRFLKTLRSAAYAFGGAGRTIWKVKAWSLLAKYSVIGRCDAILVEAVSELMRLGIFPPDEPLSLAMSLAETYAGNAGSRTQQILAAKFTLAQAWAFYYMRQYSASMEYLRRITTSQTFGRDSLRTKTICLVLADAHSLESRLLCLPKELLYDSCVPNDYHLIGPLEASRDSAENAIQVVGMFKELSQTQGWEFLGQFEMVLGILFDSVVWRLKVLNHIAQPKEMTQIGKATLFHAQSSGLTTRSVELLLYLTLADLLTEQSSAALVKVRSIYGMISQEKPTSSTLTIKPPRVATYSPRARNHTEEVLRDVISVVSDTVIISPASPIGLKKLPTVDRFVMHSRNCLCSLCGSLVLLVNCSLLSQVTCRVRIMVGEQDSDFHLVLESFDRFLFKVRKSADTSCNDCDTRLFSEHVQYEYTMNVVDALLEYVIVLGLFKKYEKAQSVLQKVEEILFEVDGPVSMSLQGLLEKFSALSMECEMAMSEEAEVEVSDVENITKSMKTLAVTRGQPNSRPTTPTNQDLPIPNEDPVNAPRKGRRPLKFTKPNDIIEDWDEVQTDLDARRSRLLDVRRFELPAETPAPSRVKVAPKVRAKVKVYVEDVSEVIKNKSNTKVQGEALEPSSDRNGGKASVAVSRAKGSLIEPKSGKDRIKKKETHEPPALVSSSACGSESGMPVPSPVKTAQPGPSSSDSGGTPAGEKAQIELKPGLAGPDVRRGGIISKGTLVGEGSSPGLKSSNKAAKKPTSKETAKRANKATDSPGSSCDVSEVPMMTKVGVRKATVKSGTRSSEKSDQTGESESSPVKKVVGRRAATSSHSGTESRASSASQRGSESAVTITVEEQSVRKRVSRSKSDSVPPSKAIPALQPTKARTAIDKPKLPTSALRKNPRLPSAKLVSSLTNVEENKPSHSELGNTGHSSSSVETSSVKAYSRKGTKKDIAKSGPSLKDIDENDDVFECGSETSPLKERLSASKRRPISASDDVFDSGATVCRSSSTESGPILEQNDEAYKLGKILCPDSSGDESILDRSVSDDRCRPKGRTTVSSRINSTSSTKTGKNEGLRLTRNTSSTSSNSSTKAIADGDLDGIEKRFRRGLRLGTK